LVKGPADSPLVGRTLAEAALRQETGAGIVAIKREDETVTNPEGSTVIEAEDTLVALGDRDADRRDRRLRSDGFGACDPEGPTPAIPT
jgi:TrkA domain protein